MYLNEIVQKKDNKFKELVHYITTQVMTQSQIQKTYAHFRKTWKLETSVAEMPQVIMTEKDLLELARSKQINQNMGGRMTRSISRNYSI